LWTTKLVAALDWLRVTEPMVASDVMGTAAGGAPRVPAMPAARSWVISPATAPGDMTL